MKILFVDESSNLQEKWIEPLRGEGWGVVRARSVEDAEKIFEFHGDSLDALVVSEVHAEWAEKWNYPYVVFMKKWKEIHVLKHQNNSSHPATAYLDYDSSLELVKQAIVDSKNQSQQASLKSTGTSASIQSLAPLESASAPSQQSESSDSLVISFEKYADQKAVIESTSRKASPTQETTDVPEIVEPIATDSDRTMMIDSTSLSHLDLSPKVEEFIQETVELTAPADEIQENTHENEDAFEIEASPASYTPDFTASAVGNKDLETMKNYLALREQDVALLTGQMRSTHERVQQLEMQLKVERARSGELQHMVQKQEQQIKNFERDKQVEFEVLYAQVEDLNLQLRERTDKVRTIEAKLKITTDEVEKVKERVRVDIRRIRVREKELESQLEILKKDSTALLVARDEKILELKRKIDLLEFNMELVQEQYGKERNQTEQLRHKLKEAAGVMKRAGGLLDHEN